jgi:23S rRNA (guanosine2251-2'-O)-methyltransferase
MKRLLLGPRAVTEGLRAAPERLAVIYAATDVRGPAAQVLELARERQVRVESRSRADLDALAGADRHQGVLAIAGEYAYASLDELLVTAGDRPLLLALDQITDPHNFGAIIRSAVALGASGVVTLKDRAAPVTSAVVRASAGATEVARIARVTNLARTLVELKDAGWQVVGLDASGDTELSGLPRAANGRVLVIGSEGSGLRRLVREQCEMVARIAMNGPLHSLNAAVAAGIALYESVRAR